MERKAGTATPRRYTPRLPPEERRDQILDAVLEVIAEQGATGVSVDGIARRLGFTRPVVYGHFKDSRDMLRASLVREEERALAQLLALVPSGTSVKADDLTAAFRAYLEAVLAEPLRWRAILLPIGPAPALVSTVRRGRDRMVELLTAVLESTTPPSVDRQLAAAMLVTLAEEAGRLALTETEDFTVERLASFAESVTPAILHAIRG